MHDTYTYAHMHIHICTYTYTCAWRPIRSVETAAWSIAGATGELQARVLFLPESAAAQAAGSSMRATAARGPGGWAPPDSDSPPSTSGSSSTRLYRDLGVRASSTVVVSEAVMKKLTGLENVDGVEAVVELDLPPMVDFAGGEIGGQGGALVVVQAGWRPCPAISIELSSSCFCAGTLKEVRRLLALDRVQDPGNMGTLLRTAIAFGWDGVFLLPGCTDPFGDKAVRAGRGAALRVPIGRGSLEDLQRVVAARRLVMVAAEPEEQQAEAESNEGREEEAEAGVCLVLGSEGQGLALEVLAVCRPVAIPMAGKQMESLNVGIAGGILMFMLSPGLPRLSKRLQDLRVVPPR
jgi:tRNA G18 (ribose-2'-O)-methylase SpoU